MKLIIMITAVLTLTGCGMDTEGLSVLEYIKDPQELDAAVNDCMENIDEMRYTPKCRKLDRARELTFYSSNLFGQCVTANTRVLFNDKDRTVDQDCIERVDREHDDTEGLTLIEYLKNPQVLDKSRSICDSTNWRGIASSPRCKKVRQASSLTYHKSRAFGQCVISEERKKYNLAKDKNRTVDADCVDRIAREQGLN